MSKVTSPRELLSFKRTFALVIVLVVVPSAGLSGFGVLAIINERAAVEKKLADAWTGKLRRAGQKLQEVLTSSLTQLPEGTVEVAWRQGTRPPVMLSDVGFMLVGTDIQTPDLRLKQTLGALRADLETLPDGESVFSVAGNSGTVVLAVVRSGSKMWGARVPLESVNQVLKALTPEEDVRFAARPVKRESEGVLGKLASEVAEAKAALGSPPALAEQVMAPPFQDLRVSALAIGVDPVAQRSARNRTVYVVLLVLFYLTLAGGVIYTGRTLYREARLSRLKT
ncbi:MAG: two-component sensor histidine kinase, partial [Myxococcaceae bacterium]